MTFLDALFAVALLAADPSAAPAASPNASPVESPAASPLASPAPQASPSRARRDFSIPTIDEAPVLDGKLDDPVWQKATRLDDFTNFRPIEDTKPSQKTTVYIYRDAEHLYVAFDAEDTEPEKIRATIGDRDGVSADDGVLLLIDTFATGRRGYLFAVNPLGVLVDCLESDTGNDDCAWDGIYYAAARLNGHGYAAEMSIPFATVRLDPDNDEWAIDPMRLIARTSEQSVFSPLHMSGGSILSQLPRMRGMKGLKVVPTWQLIPEITARTGPGADTGNSLVSAGRPHGLSSGTSEGDVGLTARVSRGDVSGDLTVNPDFSQVESDTSRVTINQRFPLSYDEKRPFFFEGREQFNLPWNVIYTRSIVDPIYGLKISGKAGPTSFSILNAADAHPADSTVDPTWTPAAYGGAAAVTTVGRATSEISDAITMGFVGTEKQIDGAANRVVGPDIVVHLPHSWTFVNQTLWSATDNPDTSYEEGTAVKFRVMHNDRHWSWFNWYEQTDNGFRAEAGFIPRVGYREAGADTSYRFETGRTSGLLFVRPDLYVRALNATNNDDLNRDIAQFVGFNFGHSFIGPTFSWYSERFEHVLFEKKRVSLDASTSYFKWLDLAVSANAGDEISYFETASPYVGSSAVANVTATVKPFERASVGVTWYREIFSRAHSLAPQDFNAQGVYDATVARANAQVFFTRYLSARVITQWTTTDWKLSVSTLIGYRPGPGQIFYIGYQDAAPGKPGIDTTQDRALFAKASWLFGN